MKKANTSVLKSDKTQNEYFAGTSRCVESRLLVESWKMPRNKYYRPLVFLFLVLYGAAFSHARPLFNGKWEYVENVPGPKKPYSVFDITLNEDKNGEIYGRYCFVTQYGNRDDCSPVGESNIHGRAMSSSRIASVNFYSFFGAKDGIAEIFINDENSLTWKVIRPPKEGEYYGPNRMIARKVESEKNTHIGEKLVVANKAYLYNEPSVLNHGRVFVVKGDYVKLIKISADLRFWEVEFAAKNGKVIEKWIDCQDIDFCAK